MIKFSCPCGSLVRQTHKSRILLENDDLRNILKRQIASFTNQINHLRRHESLSKPTRADVYYGRGLATQTRETRKVKEEIIRQRRLLHKLQTSLISTPTSDQFYWSLDKTHIKRPEKA